MLEDLRREINRLGAEFQPKCAPTGDRLRVDIRVDDWLRFLELMYHESVLTFSKLRCLTAVDTGKNFEAIAELISPYWTVPLSVRTSVGYSQKLPSIAKLWLYSDWMEWEMQELFGLQMETEKPPTPFILRASRVEFPLRLRR